jgi:Tfp pilus assembly protein PilV
MFAVVILGIGFIMVAGMLPVAIRLSQQSADETIAASTAQRVFQSIQSQATSSLFPATAPGRNDTVIYGSALNAGTAIPGYNAPFTALGEADPTLTSANAAVQAAAAAQFNAFRADLVSSLDRTYGVAIAYSRVGQIGYTGTVTGVTSPGDSIRVVAVVARVRDRSTFNDEDAGSSSTKQGKDVKIPGTDTSQSNFYSLQFVDRNGPAAQKTPATLQFKRLTARFNLGANGAPDTITFQNSITGDFSCVGPGAFVIVADVDPTNHNPCYAGDGGSSAAHGKVFRIGDFVDGGSATPTYQLYIGYDLSTLPASERPPVLNNHNVEVLVLGKSLLNPTAIVDPPAPTGTGTNPYVNQPLDIAVYTTTIGLRP